MLVTLLLSTLAYAGMPLWISEGSFYKKGDLLILVCSGKGESITKARSEAMNSCVESAGEQLPTTWKLKSKSEETADDVKLKKEVLADQRVTGLNCDVLKEFVDTSKESPAVYVKCKFDLAKAKSTALNMEKITAANAVGIDARPGCDYVYVSGGPFTREIPCEKDKITTVTIAASEDRITIHKKRGYRAVSLKLNPDVTYQEFVVHMEKRDAHTDDWMYTGEEAKNMRPLKPSEFEIAPDDVIRH